jgi:hypothetical protein
MGLGGEKWCQTTPPALYFSLAHVHAMGSIRAHWKFAGAIRALPAAAKMVHLEVIFIWTRRRCQRWAWPRKSVGI